MSKINLLITCVIALVVLNLGLMGAFMMKGGKRPPPRLHLGHNAPGFLEILNFDESQKKQFRQLMMEHQSSIEKIDQKILIVKEELYQNLKEENTEKKDSLLKVLGDFQIEIETNHFNHFLDVKNLCSADQLKHFDEFVEELTDFLSNKNIGLPPPRKRLRH